MTPFNSRIQQLRDKHDLAELEILTAGPEDILPTLTKGPATVGQVLIVADYLNAIDSIKKMRMEYLPSTQDAPSPVFGQSETRDYNSPAPLFDGDGDDEFGSDEDLGDGPDDMTPEERTEALRQLKSMLASAFGGGEAPSYDNALVDTVSGPVLASQIPRDESGAFDSSWVDANCKCPEHTAARAAQFDDDAVPSGLYL